MQQIELAGTYRGLPQEWGVSETKNGFPQLVIRLKATEFFDENGEYGGEAGTWVDWSQYDVEITAYLVLFSNKGACLNYEQVQKALGWDGGSFAALDSGDWSTSVIQFRVEHHTYEGKESLRVNWIDAHDAEPGRIIKKLDAKGLAALDSKFKAATKAVTTPASAAPKGRPAAPPKPSAPKPADPTPAANAEAPESATTATKSDAPSGSPSEPPPTSKKKKGKKAETTDTGLPKKCTKAEAWTKVVELKCDEVTDQQLADAWLEAADEVAGEDSDESTYTSEQWAKIRDATLSRIPNIPF